MCSAEQKILDSYYRLLGGLSPAMKLNLIERLKKSIKSPEATTTELEEAFGAWHSKEPAEELIQSIRSSRNVNRQVEEL
jgi:hypothetical protein